MLVLADISGRQGGIRHRAIEMVPPGCGPPISMARAVHFQWRRWLGTRSFDALETSFYVQADRA